MTLKEYKHKRDLQKTPEPKAKIRKNKAAKSSLIFVVQKHDASHLHYDFRLEVNGVLKSWAVPKGPSLNPADKRLAIMVEDHPFDYKDFEGIIPEGNYGAGTVMVWDKGVYYPLDSNYDITDEDYMESNLQKGNVSFALQGEKLIGIFHLTKLHNKEGNQWLLIKVKDSFSSKKDILKQDRSAVSGKSLDEIASNRKRKTWLSNK